MVKPIYAHGMFVACSNGVIAQEVVFDYLDQGLYYWNLIADEGRFSRELEMLASNMQSFLNKEEVKINSRRVYPRVVGVDLGFRGSPDRPYVAFYITFRGDLRQGVNYYENIYESEVTEYDYSIVWLFTGGLKVLKANVGVDYDILSDGSILMFSVPKGFITPGYERIDFVKSIR